ncbi:hypothetical protein R0K05_09280 [Planococcus sp. SIMBA_160]
MAGISFYGLNKAAGFDFIAAYTHPQGRFLILFPIIWITSEIKGIQYLTKDNLEWKGANQCLIVKIAEQNGAGLTS